MLRNVSTVGAVVGLLLAGTAAAGPASALEPSGSAIRVDPAVNANGAGGARLLQLDGAVFMGDEIVASPNGLAQIKFIDNTRLVIGPNSRLKIDTFVFNPDNTAKKVTISALRGTFRFISGTSPHSAYTLRTPSSTIGVRGTVVDINVSSTDSSIVFQQGSGTICGHGGCVNVQHTCQIWVTPRSGGGAPTKSTGIDRERRLAVSFPFLNDQSQLAPGFQSSASNCGVADARVFGAPVRTGVADAVSSFSSPPSSPPSSPAPSNPPGDHGGISCDRPGDGHKGEGHKGEGHKGENHMGENHMGEHHMGEHHIGENHMGENHMGENRMGESHMGGDKEGDT